MSTQPTRAITPYTTRETRGVTRAEWDGWLRALPDGGHVFQSYERGEFKRRPGWRPIRVVLRRNGEVAGLGQHDEEAVRASFQGVHTPLPSGKVRTR